MITRPLTIALLLTFWVGAAVSDDATPELASCRVCELRGAAHGKEEVAASREYEGTTYHFCSESCAETFDGFPAGYAIHPLPRPAPPVAVTTTDDERVVLDSVGEGAMLIDFWATWCAPCVEAMPELAEMQERFENAGLRVLGVSIDEDREKFERFLRRKPMAYSVALDSREEPAWYAFSVAAIPSMFLIDDDGNIVAEWKGEIALEAVSETVEALLTIDAGD